MPAFGSPMGEERMATTPASEPHSAAGVHGDSILLAEVLLDLAERAQAYTNAAGVAIALIRGRDMLVRTSTGRAPEVGATIPLSDGFISECIRTRKPLTCRDVESDSRVGPVLRAFKTRSLMAIPVCEVRDVRGMMLVIAPLPNSLQPTHISILMTLSDIIAAKLREHESAVQVEIQLFDDTEEMPEIPAEPPTNLSSIDINEIMGFESEPANSPIPPAMPMTAAPAASAASILDPVPPPVPSVEFPGAPNFRSLFESPAIPPPPAIEFEPPVVSTPAPVVSKAPAATMPAPAVSKAPAAPPVPFAAAPAPPVIKPPVSEPPVPFAVKAPPAIEPPAPFAVKAPSVIEPPPAPFAVKAPPATAPSATKPVTPPAPAVPPLGSPALPITPALAMMEEKIELGERDPGLLTPAEDPGRFKRNRTFTASTLKPSVPTTSATTIPKPAPPTPFAVVEPPTVNVELAKTPVVETAKPSVLEPAKPDAAEPAILSAPAAPVASVLVPALTSWEETPRENQAKRPWLVPVGVVAAVLVIVVGFWIHSATSKEVPAPVIPVPGKNVAALPAIAPVPPAPAPAAQPPAKPAVESAKTTKPAETKARSEPEEEAPQPVIEIAAGQPKPKQEPEPDVPAPKLDLPTRDASINNLSRVRVAVPAAPKSDLVPASLVSRVNPVYPPFARQLGVSGTVIMEVRIEKDGSVGTVRVTAGAMQLRQAAIEAVKQWKYKPASLNGAPIESTAEVKVNFTR